MNHPYVDDQPPDPDAPGVWGCRRRSTPSQGELIRAAQNACELPDDADTGDWWGA